MAQSQRLYDTCSAKLPAKKVSESQFDFEDVAFIKITPERAAKLDSAGECLTEAIAKLNGDTNERNDYSSWVDQTHFISFSQSNSVIHAFTLFSSELNGSYQRDLNASSTNHSGLSTELMVLVDVLSSVLPDWLEIHTGELPAEFFGPTSEATTFRLVMPDQRKISPRNASRGRKTGRKQGYQKMLADLADEAFLYHAIIRHRPRSCPENFKYQLTVRVVLFHPRHQMHTMKDVARTKYNGFECDPAESFADLGIESSLSAFFEEVYIDSHDSGTVWVSKASDLDATNASSIFDQLTGKEQYKDIFRDRYGAPDKYSDICEYDRIIAREVDLPYFINLGCPTSDTDPWKDISGKTGPTLDQLQTTKAVELEPVSVTVDVDQDEDIASLTRQTENDGTEHHFESIKKMAQYFREQGYKAYVIRQDSGSRPDLWVKSPAGEIHPVEVETRNRSRPAGVYTNIIRAALWGYRPIIVMAPKPDDDEEEGDVPNPDKIASWAIEKFAYPMAETNDTEAKLHPRSKTTAIDGETVLLPKGVSENQWWVDWRPTLKLKDGDEVLASGKPTDPPEKLLEDLPRLRREDGTYIVVDSDGAVLSKYTNKDVFKADWTKVNLPLVPVDLTFAHFVESLYVLDDRDDLHEVIEYPIHAEWNDYPPAKRHRRSLGTFFSNFLVEVDPEETAVDDVRIWEDEVVRFSKQWVRSLTEHELTEKSVFGTYRPEVSDRGSNNREDGGKDHFYRNMTYRFPRGIVAPYTSGLDTRPHFPDHWDVESGTVQEPLIDDLSDLNDIGADDDDLSLS